MSSIEFEHKTGLGKKGEREVEVEVEVERGSCFREKGRIMFKFMIF